jgi:hypothetical protein
MLNGVLGGNEAVAIQGDSLPGEGPLLRDIFSVVTVLVAPATCGCTLAGGMHGGQASSET